jgi:hypothetical protein
MQNEIYTKDGYLDEGGRTAKRAPLFVPRTTST